MRHPQKLHSVQHNTPSQNITVEDVESYAKSSIGLGNHGSKGKIVVEVLGLNCNTATDHIFFDFVNLIEYATTLPMTKKSILKITAKIFDLLGFLSPFTVIMKILFQELCIDKVE